MDRPTTLRLVLPVLPQLRQLQLGRPTLPQLVRPTPLILVRLTTPKRRQWQLARPTQHNFGSSIGS